MCQWVLLAVMEDQVSVRTFQSPRARSSLQWQSWRALKGSPGRMLYCSRPHAHSASPCSAMVLRPKSSTMDRRTSPVAWSRVSSRRLWGLLCSSSRTGAAASLGANTGGFSLRLAARTGRSMQLAPVCTVSVTGSGAGQIMGQ